MADFDTAVREAWALKDLTDMQLLELYSYFKQATVGDINVPKPGTFSVDLKAKGKWQAWSLRKGMSSDEAKAKYVALVASFKK